MIIVNIQQKNR